ncbi:hypothetical protein HH310_28490 [Actinoplanes sp. TBRC 11911]|uniref:hypothetical protein n=1 Tax=Actinoplanes sp. TBRC 11911 TaxID=2729386 RepID=UPI00145F5AE5|nr:hypothetical protein [Actinoplanes sp. TBRC 11911]NMO55112.1 hypothetical protein [Actinoplanes sp. TBRC 11911]
MSVLRSELYRTATLRSSRLSLVVAAAVGLVAGWFGAWWLLAGLGALAVAVLTTVRRYRHRSAILVFLGQPNRLRVLGAKCLAAALVAVVLAVVSEVVALLTSLTTG